MKDHDLVISLKTIFLTLLTFFLLWVFWLIKDVLLYLFIAMILALALEPFVDFLLSRKVHRGIAVILVSVGFLVIVGGLASVAVTPFIQQTQVLIGKFPQYMQSLTELPGAGDYISRVNEGILSQLTKTGSNVVTVTLGAFSGVLATILIFVFTVYILLDFENLRLMFVNLFAASRRNEIQKLVTRIETKLGGWLRGQVILMLIIGATTYIGLISLGVDYALSLAVIAGLFEIVPIIGPIISLVPAIIIGFVMSPFIGIGVIILYILIQQLENHIIVPKVMQKAIGFNPLVTIIALVVGGQLLGAVGAVLAIPFLIVFSEVVKYILDAEL